MPIKPWFSCSVSAKAAYGALRTEAGVPIRPEGDDERDLSSAARAADAGVPLASAEQGDDEAAEQGDD